MTNNIQDTMPDDKELDEILDLLTQFAKRRKFNDIESTKTVIDLSCENIIEHFNLEEAQNDSHKSTQMVQ